MTLDEELVRAVDRTVRKLKTTRSAFTRQALQAALDALAASRLDARHRAGYLAKPARKGEFDAWETEHAWGEP